MVAGWENETIRFARMENEMKTRHVAASLLLSLFTLEIATFSAQAFDARKEPLEWKSPAHKEKFHAEERLDDPFLPTLRLADLEVSARVVGPPYENTIEVTVENIGQGYASPSILTVKPLGWPSGRYIIDAVPELFPGDIATFRIWDPDLSLCFEDTVVEADRFHHVYELDETNNTDFIAADPGPCL